MSKCGDQRGGTKPKQNREQQNHFISLWNHLHKIMFGSLDAKNSLIKLLLLVIEYSKSFLHINCQIVAHCHYSLTCQEVNFWERTFLQFWVFMNQICLVPGINIQIIGHEQKLRN